MPKTMPKRKRDESDTAYIDRCFAFLAPGDKRVKPSKPKGGKPDAAPRA